MINFQWEIFSELGWFIDEIYRAYKSYHFTYLEINPLGKNFSDDDYFFFLVVTSSGIHILDLAAKVDETAAFICNERWKSRYGEPLEFPSPFGLVMSEEEKNIATMDATTGASLKLTILNRQGRVWTMVAGGGASVVFT